MTRQAPGDAPGDAYAAATRSRHAVALALTLADTTIDDPATLADWLATGPDVAAKNEAFDRLVEAHGYDRGRQMWAVALGCSREGREPAPGG